MSTAMPAHGLELKAPIPAGGEEILTPEALRFVEALVRKFAPTRQQLLAARAERQRAIEAGPAARLPRGDAAHPRERVAGRADPSRPAGPARGDHRSGRPQDDHQRAELGRQRLHGRLRGRQLADLGTTSILGQINLRDAIRRTIAFTSPEGKTYKLERADRGADGAAARLAPAREARPARRPADSRRRSSTSASTSSTTRKELLERGSGPYFYLPKLESHLEARLWNDVFVVAQALLGHAAGARSGRPCSSRRSSRPSRWTRSSTSCASTRRGSTAAAGTTSSRIIKKFRGQRGVHDARPRAGDDGHAHDAVLLEAGHRDLPSPRHPRDRRHGRADPDQGRRGGQRGGAGQGARRQGARGRRRPRRHVGGPPGPGAASPRRSSTRRCRQPNQIGKRLPDLRVDRRRIC